MKLRHILTIAIAVVALTGCRTNKTTRPEMPVPTPSTTQTPVKAGEWHDLYVPVKVRITSPMQLSLSGRATMVRDSVIHISMRVFGMEMAVANVTPDSVTIIDKYHRSYFAESTKKLLGSHEMTIGEMQDVLLGTAIGEPQEMTFGSKDSDHPVTVRFEDFADTPGGPVAGTVSITMTHKNKQVNAQLIWDTAKAEWNTGRRTDFRIPTGYRRYDKENALELLKAL